MSGRTLPPPAWDRMQTETALLYRPLWLPLHLDRFINRDHGLTDGNYPTGCPPGLGWLPRKLNGPFPAGWVGGSNHAKPGKITRPPSGKPNGKTQDDGGHVSGYALGAHLGVTRQAIDALTAQGVLTRRPDGKYAQTACRLAYIAHLKSARRGSTNAAAQSDFAKVKTRLLQLRIAEREGLLMETADALSVIDESVGITLTALSSMPGTIGGHDLALRRRVEACVNDTRREIAERCRALADACRPPEETS
jgi:hypothetical protein